MRGPPPHRHPSSSSSSSRQQRQRPSRPPSLRRNRREVRHWGRNVCSTAQQMRCSRGDAAACLPPSATSNCAMRATHSSSCHPTLILLNHTPQAARRAARARPRQARNPSWASLPRSEATKQQQGSFRLTGLLQHAAAWCSSSGGGGQCRTIICMRLLHCCPRVNAKPPGSGVKSIAARLLL